MPAATVVVLRDGPDGPEVLMLKRDQGLSFAGGMWVFPGGRIDPEDHAAEDPAAEDPAAEDPAAEDPAAEDPDPPPTATGEAMEAAARRAAVREAAEEAGIEIDPAALRRWSHWTPPPRQDKRFTTAFFVAPAVDDTADIVIDDGEIRAHRWVRPGDAIALRDAGDVSLAPPTYITLVQLLPHRSVAEALAAADGAEVEHFATRVAVVGDSWIALYHGDVAYEQAEPDPTLEGPRHRLVMESTWTYLREGC